jgi:hypothetical protein
MARHLLAVLDPRSLSVGIADEHGFFLDQYRQALDAARGPVSGGMALEEAVRVYHPAS